MENIFDVRTGILTAIFFGITSPKIIIKSNETKLVTQANIDAFG